MRTDTGFNATSRPANHPLQVTKMNKSNDRWVEERLKTSSGSNSKAPGHPTSSSELKALKPLFSGGEGKPAIGLIELNSIAGGIETADAMVKRATVDLLEARSVCPGKFIILIGGLTGPVAESMEAGLETAGDAMVDSLNLPNVHLSIFPAITGCVEAGPERSEALGIVETFTVASTIVSGDAAAKAAGIRLTDMRLANGLGGKSFFLMTGPVYEVEAGVEASLAILREEGLLVRHVIIPRLHEDVRAKMIN